MHSENVAGTPSQICWTTLRSLAYDMSWPVKICFIIVRYCTTKRLVEPEIGADPGDQRRVGVLPGDSRGRVGIGDDVEDQEHDHRDREQHRGHAEQAPGDESGHCQCSSLIFARGSKASRRPSPNTLSDNTVATIIKPGTTVRCGAVKITW